MKNGMKLRGSWVRIVIGLVVIMGASELIASECSLCRATDVEIRQSRSLLAKLNAENQRLLEKVEQYQHKNELGVQHRISLVQQNSALQQSIRNLQNTAIESSEAHVLADKELQKQLEAAKSEVRRLTEQLAPNYFKQICDRWEQDYHTLASSTLADRTAYVALEKDNRTLTRQVETRNKVMQRSFWQNVRSWRRFSCLKFLSIADQEEYDAVKVDVQRSFKDSLGFFVVGVGIGVAGLSLWSRYLVTKR